MKLVFPPKEGKLGNEAISCAQFLLTEAIAETLAREGTLLRHVSQKRALTSQRVFVCHQSVFLECLEGA